MTAGISVIICCYNSEKRIVATLKALSEQVVAAERKWEVILVDNCCTDNTVSIASLAWQDFGKPAPLIVITEAKPGLTYARQAGIQVSEMSLLLFCDDDNWLSNNYIDKAAAIMDSDHYIGACGGRGIPILESAEPDWFTRFQEAYAVGPQDITSEHGRQFSLYGAGLVVRASVLTQIKVAGIGLHFTDRVGNSLSSSGDTELTNLICLLGYRNIYSEELRFSHFIPAERLNRVYLTRLFTAFGNDGPIRNIYHAFLSGNIFHLVCLYWPGHFLLTLGRLIKYSVVPPKKGERAIYLRWNIAYLKALLKLWNRHQHIVNQLRAVTIHQGSSLLKNKTSASFPEKAKHFLNL